MKVTKKIHCEQYNMVPRYIKALPSGCETTIFGEVHDASTLESLLAEHASDVRFGGAFSPAELKDIVKHMGKYFPNHHAFAKME